MILIYIGTHFSEINMRLRFLVVYWDNNTTFAGRCKEYRNHKFLSFLCPEASWVAMIYHKWTLISSLHFHSVWVYTNVRTFNFWGRVSLYSLVGLELVIFLCLTLKCWDYRLAPSNLPLVIYNLSCRLIWPSKQLRHKILCAALS